MEDKMKILTGLGIGALVFISIIMAAGVIGGTVDDTIADVNGHFTIIFNDQPTDGDTVTITYGRHTETYEFDTDGIITPGNIRVVPAPH
jgi:hypothetical protein